MKPNPAEKTVHERMQPGALSLEGFLGSDERSLEEIIAADAGEIAEAGFTNEQLGAFLEALHAAADAAWESRVPACNGKTTVRVEETLGQIPCPFACGEHCHKATIQVNDPKGNRLLSFTPLDAHLIRKHGFFQGKGSPYRIEPAFLIELYRRCNPAP